ncbi:MAG: hypothetical protein AAGD43_32960, partial [Pseudomonadota bacterium]
DIFQGLFGGDTFGCSGSSNCNNSGTGNIRINSGAASYFYTYQSAADTRASYQLTAVPVSAVPLPSGLPLLLVSLAGLAGAQRLRGRARSSGTEVIRRVAVVLRTGTLGFAACKPHAA